MKTLFAALALTAAMFLQASVGAAEKNTRCYEMRVYYAHPGKLNDLHARFRNHTMRLFEKHGMQNIGYWVPMGENKEEKLVYILAYPSREARDKSWKGFMGDPDWQKAFRESHANGELVIGEKIQEIYMEATDYSPDPKPEVETGGRVFELRTYTSAPGKLADLNARFRNHTVKLFAKYGMKNIGYWNKLPGQKEADTTLIYFLSHKSRDAAKESFGNFGKDPEWISARAESEKNGPLTASGGVKSEFFTATDYSPLR